MNSQPDEKRAVSHNSMTLRHISGMITRAVFLIGLTGAWFMLSGCMQNVVVRGTVRDVSGQELPGVAVYVEHSEYEALSNGTGYYSLRATPGAMQVLFMKTGYAPLAMPITAAPRETVMMPDVRLWPLPPGEGVFLFNAYRYTQTNHPRVNKYRLEGGGIAWGTPVNPTLDIPWVNPENGPEQNPPVMIAHRLPAYDARMHRLKKAKASQLHAMRLGVKASADKEINYNEEVWIAEEIVPIQTQVIDEADKLLVKLRAATPLEPGVYAMHWGALEGYDSIDPRVFLFSMSAPEPESADTADEAAPQEKPADTP